MRAHRRAARHRAPARPPARQALGRRAPARRDRPRAADAAAAPAARRAARLARHRAQARNPALSRAAARRRPACRWSMSATIPASCGVSRLQSCGSTADASPRSAAWNCSTRSTPTRFDASMRRMFPPERIVCLTEETVETLYLLGEERRIVGVSGYAVRPPRVRKEKPRVSAFITADFEKILALEPDLVLTFSDLQADIVAELIRRGDRGPCFQPARHRRHSRDDPHARRAGRRVAAKADALARFAGSSGCTQVRTRSAQRRAATARLFRGMGRADDLRHRLGVGTRSRRPAASTCSPTACRRQERQGSHRHRRQA